MKRTAVFAGVFVCFLGIGCHEQVKTSQEAYVSPTEEETQFIARTEELGAQVYLHDQCAARATSLLYAHGVDLAEKGTQGWITEGRPDGCAVTFVAGDPESWRSVCVVTFAGGAEPNIILVDKDLTETQSAMLGARQLVLGIVKNPCSEAYNTVVIPQEGRPGWLAYALAATSDPNLLLVGGHYRATVSADGQTILEQRSFTRECLVLKSSEVAGPDVDVAAFTVGHILDARPTEIHVFLNLLCGKPLYVVTADRRFWRIENGKIRLLKLPTDDR
ncbi:MAG: hypothetical protein ABFE13_09065 [Phycisphaerales bacterium]